MGGCKALLPLEGTTFLGRVLETARAVPIDRIVVVLGHQAAEVERLLSRDDDVIVAQNPDPRRGQLSSLKIGVEAVGAVDGILVWPVDHPRIRVETLRSLLEAGRTPPARVVIPCHMGQGGHPTFVPRDLFTELQALPQDAGARDLWRAHPERVLRLTVKDPGVLVDIDTPEDYARLVDR
jgi:CTP:molybdopterin cytidylyltransferase MocA